MIPTLRRPLHRPRTLRLRPGRLIVALAVLALVAACGGRSEDQLAQDELNAGLAASAAGNADQAVAHYKACLKHDSLNQFCIHNLGVHAMRAGRTLEAENDYRLALLIDPDFPSALFNLAYIQSQAANPVATQEAIALYRHFVQIRPDEANGHLNLGVLLLQTGNVAGGNAEIAAALKLDPTIAVPTVAPSPSPSPSPSASATATASPSP